MTDEPTKDRSTEPGAPARAEPRRIRGAGPLLYLAVGALAGTLGLGVYSGISARSAADATLRRATEEAAIGVVNVVSPNPSAPTQEIVLPGTTQAFTDAPIFARTNGYVKSLAWVNLSVLPLPMVLNTRYHLSSIRRSVLS